MRIMFTLLGIIFLQISKSNLLITPIFDFPLMPPHSNYYLIQPGFYPFWWFLTRTAYVPFNYPLIPQIREEQFLFLEESGTVIRQIFRLHNAQHRSFLKVTVHFRMPFYNTSGKVDLCIRNEIVLTLTYEPTLRNLIIVRSGFLMIRTSDSIFFIRTKEFENPTPQLYWKNGFQIRRVEINHMTYQEKEFFLLTHSANSGKLRAKPKERRSQYFGMPKIPE